MVCKFCGGDVRINRITTEHDKFDIIQHEASCNGCTFYAETTMRKWHKTGKEDILWDRWWDGDNMHLGGILRKPQIHDIKREI